MEIDFLQWLRRDFRAEGNVIGDDAAVLDWPARANCVAATDLLADGVHFQLDEVGAELAGRKAIAVNLSDMAAMAAQPQAVLVSLLLPRHGAAHIARQAMLGLQALAREFHVTVAGGDTNVWDGAFVINVAILGTTFDRPPWTRHGMLPGDWLLASGPFGGSGRGHHLHFTPRVREAIELASQYPIHAAIDVSDGLSLDASRLGLESGCGVVLERQSIPIASAAFAPPTRESDRDALRSPLEHALYDGEDFELLVAMDERQASALLASPPSQVPWRRVGYATAEQGLWLTDEAGLPCPLQSRGFEHGASA